MKKFALALTSMGLVAATALVGPAAAMAESGNCLGHVGWSNANGTAATAVIAPAKPPRSTVYPSFKFPAARSSASWYGVNNNTGTRGYYYGLFLQGSNLYRHTTFWNGEVGQPTATKLGSGWAGFKSIATAKATYVGSPHTFLYGLNSNGRLYRYRQTGASMTAFRSYGSFAGFKSFKAMTVASETETYDTLLMTTTAGALYTVHIPLTATAKPVVKRIRSTGWAAYESLILQGCGARGGSLVIGVDHDTDSGYAYAFSRFAGPATAMTSYGKIPTKFPGTTHVSFTTHYDQLDHE